MSGPDFGVRLCLGDMNNRAFATMDDVTPLVLWANAADGRAVPDRTAELCVEG